MDKIRNTIDDIAARCEDDRTVQLELKTIEIALSNIETRMKNLYEEVVKDQKDHRDELQFTAAARACNIIGISIEELMEIEKNVN